MDLWRAAPRPNCVLTFVVRDPFIQYPGDRAEPVYPVSREGNLLSTDEYFTEELPGKAVHFRRSELQRAHIRWHQRRCFFLGENIINKSQTKWKTHLADVQNTPDSNPIHAQNMPNICPTHALNIQEHTPACREHSHNNPRTKPEHDRSMPNTSSTHAQKMATTTLNKART